MKNRKPNAGVVYYFIMACIKSSVTSEQLDSCGRMVDNIAPRNYLFADYLAAEILIRRCELIAERYPIYE